MTLVVAKRFGKRIVVISDTMISDERQSAANTFPGRLKSIVINKWLTISYAGLSSQALDVIRSIAKRHDLTTATALGELVRANIEYKNEIEFILCSHEDQVRVLKIANGRVSEGGDSYWIGNANAAAELSKMIPEIPPIEGLPDYMSLGEVTLTKAFVDFLSSGDSIRYGVGGAVVNCLCSDAGHCYQRWAGAFAWDFTNSDEDPLANEIRRKAGMGHFTYNVYAPETRGQAIVGLYFDQSETAYVYVPMKHDEAIKVPSITHDGISRLLEDISTSAENPSITLSESIRLPQ